MHEINVSCCVKNLTVLFSCLYWILGLCITIGSLWIINDPIFSLMFTQYADFFYIINCIVIIAGGFILLSAWFACYGIVKRSKCILSVFVCTLLIVVIFEIIAGLWIIKNVDRFSDIIRASMKHSLQEEYGQISTTTVTFDVIQKRLKCCGADGPSDWIASRYNNVGRDDLINIAFSSLNMFFNIPESCCHQNLSEITCEMARKHKLDSVYHEGVYDEGCVSKLTQIISNNSKVLLTVLISGLTLEIIGLVLSFYVCCRITKTKKNK